MPTSEPDDSASTSDDHQEGKKTVDEQRSIEITHAFRTQLVGKKEELGEVVPRDRQEKNGQESEEGRPESMAGEVVASGHRRFVVLFFVPYWRERRRWCGRRRRGSTGDLIALLYFFAGR